MNDISANTS